MKRLVVPFLPLLLTAGITSSCSLAAHTKGSRDSGQSNLMADSFAGKTLQELNIRQRHGIWVVGVKDPLTGELTMFPAGDFRLAIDQILLVVGKRSDLGSLRDVP